MSAYPVLGDDIIEALRRRKLADVATTLQRRDAPLVAEEDAIAPPRGVDIVQREQLADIASRLQGQDRPLAAEQDTVTPPRRVDFGQRLRDEWMRGGPEQQEAVLRDELGPAYDVLVSPETKKYREMAQAGPSQHKPGGFWSRAKDVALGAGLGARRGGFVGMLAGGVGSAVDPNVAHKLRYEDVELPQAYGRARAEQELLGEDIQRALAVSKLSGKNPYTGEATPDAENAYLRNTINQDRAAAYIKGQESLVRARDRRADVNEINAILKAQSHKGVITPETIARIKQQYGVELPPTFNPEKHQVIVDSAGNAQVVNLNTGAATAVTADGKTVSTMQGRRQGETERHNKEQERHNRELEAINKARESRLATTGGTNRITKVDVQVAVTDEWMQSGRTSGGKTIQDGYVVDGYTKTPLEEHPEYKREVNRRYSAANKKPASPARTASKLFPASELDAFARDHGISPEEARKRIESGGYTIK